MSKSEKSKPVALRLPHELVADLEGDAERVGVPLATFITALLKRYARGDVISRTERGSA